MAAVAYDIRIRWGRVAGLVAAVAALTVVALGAEGGVLAVTTGSWPAAKQDHGRLGRADGALPDDASVYDDTLPGVAKLDPALLGALRAAAGQGVGLVVQSGWRSAAYQAQLLREAIQKYGSEEEAARWVATPERSAHVAGDAVDIGPPEAAAWLADHGAAFGLCRIYANEPWHFELRPGGCPALYADASQDPRMR
jgi:hypothetical protein